MAETMIADPLAELFSPPFEARGARLSAEPMRPFWRVAAWPDRLGEVGAAAAEWAGAASAPGPREAVEGTAGALLRTEPLAWRLYGAEPGELDGAAGALLDITHAWSALSLSGPRARDVLARLVPIDLRERAAPVGYAASTMLHHVGITLWRRGVEDYVLFLPRSYAVSLSEVALEAARSR